MSDVPQAFIREPGHISNAQLIERLKQWGARQVIDDTPRDGTVLMELIGGHAVWVNAADNPLPNSPGTINEILEHFGVSWNQFASWDMRELWSRVASHRRQTRRTPESEDLPEGEAVEDADPADEATPPPTPPEPESTRTEPRPESPKPAERTKRERKQKRIRIINHVFDALVTAGEAMSTDRLAKELGRPKGSITTACSSLVNQGVVERVKPAVYRVKPEHNRQDVRVDVVARAEEAHDDEPDSPRQSPRELGVVLPTTPMPELPREPLTDGLADTDTEATIIELLDLLLPNGFRARHLPAVIAWRDLTRRLIHECTEDAE